MSEPLAPHGQTLDPSAVVSTTVLPPGRPVRAWDRFVRVFHWTVVVCVVGNLFVFEDGERTHQVAGYIAGAMVLLRLLWGWVGTTTARFASFVPTRAQLQRYLTELRDGRAEPTVGHNPLGALMVLALLALLLLLGVSGFLQTLELFHGADWLEEVHEALANGLELLCLVHVAAVVVMSRRERVNLARAMVTGVKLRQPDQAATIRRAGIL